MPGNPTLTLEGNATGAVKALSDISTGAQNLKGKFDEVAQSAKGLTSELESGGGAGSAFANGLSGVVGYLGALAGPGALLAGTVAGLKDYNEQLQKAADLSANFGPLSQLGPGALQEARGLTAAGAGENAAAIAQSLQGASPTDAAFIRAAASTKVFANIPAMELSARAYERQFGGDLPSLVGQAGAAFGGTGLNAEQGLAQIQSLSPAFEGAGIGGQAGLALAGTAAQLFGGEGTGKIQQFLQRGTATGVFADMPANIRNNPAAIIDYIRSQGTDDQTLEKEFGARSIITAKALLGAGSDLSARYNAIQNASPTSAYDMLHTAESDTGLAAAEAERQGTGIRQTTLERSALLRKLYTEAAAQDAFRTTRNEGAFGGLERFLQRQVTALDTTILPDSAIVRGLQSQADRGDLTPQLLKAIHTELQGVNQNTKGGPTPGGQ